MSAFPEFDLAFGISFQDLYAREGLLRIDARFLEHLPEVDGALHARLLQARENPHAGTAKEHSELIIDLAPHVEDFLGELFGIRGEVAALQTRHNDLAPLLAFKRRFVQKKAISGVTREQAGLIDGPQLSSEVE